MPRPPVPVEMHRRFWQQVAAGLSVVDAAAASGMSRATAQRLYSRSGGVMPTLRHPRKTAAQGGRLTLAEREEIARLRAAGVGVRAIARELERDPGTVSRELRRNAGRGGVYRASTAQQRADQNACAGGRARPAKLAVNLRLRREVQTRLEERHSPEQIARRLREDFPDDPEMWVSHETIYQSLCVQGRGGAQAGVVGLPGHWPGAAQAQARRGRGDRIKNMVMISERPPEVADRAVPGHWEADLLM